MSRAAVFRELEKQLPWLTLVGDYFQCICNLIFVPDKQLESSVFFFLFGLIRKARKSAVTELKTPLIDDTSANAVSILCSQSH